MFGIAIVILIVSVLIVGHEIGHFLVARLFGLQTPVFGLGLPYGPSWVVGKKWDTQLRIHLLLFGAYVSIPELDREPSEENLLAKPFRLFPLWQRVLVVLGGGLFYIVFAWCTLYASISVVGEPIQQVIVQSLAATNPIAANAGIKCGDQIVSLDLRPISTPDEVAAYFRAHPASAVKIRVLRSEQQVDLSITSNIDGRVGMALGIGSQSKYRRCSLPESFGLATQKIFSLPATVFASSGIMLSRLSEPTPAVETGGRRHGILMIGVMMGDIIAHDWRQLPLLVAMLSFDIALVNLLPFPGLDGGHLLVVLINGARKKPLNEGRIGHWAFVGALVLSLLSNGMPLCLLRGHQTRSKN